MSISSDFLYIHRVRIKKDQASSVNNFNKFKRIFTIFGTHYLDDNVLLKTKNLLSKFTDHYVALT